LEHGEGALPQASVPQHAVTLAYHVNATIGNVTRIQLQAGRWFFEVNDDHNVTRTGLANSFRVLPLSKGETPQSSGNRRVPIVIGVFLE
jgi:hypothetical protein